MDFKLRYSKSELSLCKKCQFSVANWSIPLNQAWLQVINIYFLNKKLSNACLKLILGKNVRFWYTIFVLQDILKIYKSGNKLTGSKRSMFGVWIYPGKSLNWEILALELHLVIRQKFKRKDAGVVHQTTWLAQTRRISRFLL